ncbi:MAG TPA: hypothetical protein VFV80_02395, partial [Geminicoccaceae bacterium]|nr:hypothetical protein [Geminicoccaceae bacterium]
MAEADTLSEAAMYLARFSYDVLPVHRERAIAFIRGEIAAARRDGLQARLLVPLTRGRHGAALQFEVQLGGLEQLEQVRHGGGPDQDTGDWDARLQRDPARAAESGDPARRRDAVARPSRTPRPPPARHRRSCIHAGAS